MQNADDAGAKEVHIGLSAGLPRTKHPLLQGPALFLLNDGPFSRRDYEAIQSFGLNSKAEDSDTIGKFGLGMKSVFHLCEAFFFRATSNGHRCKEVLNPWSGTTEGSVKSLHGDWDEVEDADFWAIEEEVANATGRIPLSSHPVNFLLSMAAEYAEHGVRVNAIAPGATRTARVAALAQANEHVDRLVREDQLFGWCEPRDVANMALYLASDESRVTTGQILSVDGGATV